MALFDDARTKAFKTQLRALDVPRYEVTVRTPDDLVQASTLAQGDLLRQEKWLRGQNERGAQIRVQPDGPSPLVLVGPLRPTQLERMADDGFPPALATITGDDRVEAWVRLSRDDLPAGLAEAMGQVLNGRYTDGGPGGAPREGSLAAGFVDTRDPLTRAPEHRELYVDVVQTSREIAPGAAMLRDEVLEHMRLPGDALVALTRTDRDERGAPDRDERGLMERSPARAAAEREEGLAALVAAFKEAGLPLERGVEVSVRERSPAAATRASGPTPAEQFGRYRELALQPGSGADRTSLDARQAEWKAAHQLLRAEPTLSRDALVAAMREGGATGATAKGMPADREAYLVTTAGRALEAAQRQAPPQTPRGGERGR